MAKDTDNDAAQDKAQVAAGVHKHESALHKGEPKTKLKKGGKMKFAKGGKTNAQMLKLGRNRAKIANQKSSSRGKGK